jgi:Fur family iron response transcriptional regulator
MPTRQRVDIAHALFARCAHLSAEQLLHAVNADHGEVAKATIYNTLSLLLEKGLIREVIVDPGRVFYDPNTEPHHHFYNVETGELIDIQADDLHLTGLPKPPSGTVTEFVDVIIRIRPAVQSSLMGV